MFFLGSFVVDEYGMWNLYPRPLNTNAGARNLSGCDDYIEFEEVEVVRDVEVSFGDDILRIQ